MVLMRPDKPVATADSAASSLEPDVIRPASDVTPPIELLALAAAVAMATNAAVLVIAALDLACPVALPEMAVNEAPDEGTPVDLTAENRFATNDVTPPDVALDFA